MVFSIVVEAGYDIENKNFSATKRSEAMLLST